VLQLSFPLFDQDISRTFALKQQGFRRVRLDRFGVAMFIQGILSL
jgi:hypothetical protein